MRIMKAILILVLLLATGCTLKSSTPPAGTVAPKTTGSPADATKIAGAATQQSVQGTETPSATTKQVQKVKWGSYRLEISSVVVGTTFPAGCTGEPPTCTTAKTGKEIVSVTFTPTNLAEGKELPYKKLPAVKITNDKKKAYSTTLKTYNAETNELTLGFVVPAGSQFYKLSWPGNSSLKLNQ